MWDPVQNEDVGPFVQKSEKKKKKSGELPFKILKYFDEKDSHLLMEGMQYGTSTLEDSLAFSYKTEHTLTIQSSNHTLFTQS